MKLENAELLMNQLLGIMDIEVHEDYSGRGMYGATTTGIIVDSERSLMIEAAKVISEHLSAGNYEMAKDIADALTDINHRDTMGRYNIILY